MSALTTRGGTLLAVLVALCLAWLCGCGGRTTGGASPDASVGDDKDDGDGGACEISASNFDQSCSVDTDCTEVSAGNYCVSGCMCGGSAINVGALPQFNAAVAKTPVGSGAIKGGACPCPYIPGPCCRHGTCTGDCYGAGDTLPACADAGGTCMFLGQGASCSPHGPPNSCAYPDETCCG